MALKILQKNKNKDGDDSSTKKCAKEEKSEEHENKKKTKVSKKNKQRVSIAVSVQSSHNIIYSRPSLPLLPTPMVTTMATYYPQNFPQPIVLEWNPMVATMSTIQVPTPVYTLPFQPLPVILSPIVPPICPYACTVLTPPAIPPVVPPPIITEIPPECAYSTEPSTSYQATEIENRISEQICYQTLSVSDQVVTRIDQAENQVNEPYYQVQDENVVSNIEQIIESPAQVNDTYYSVNEDTYVKIDDVAPQELNIDPLEIYLSLPRDLFPTPRMLTIDPNPIIDEFCKLKNVQCHVPWLLDLEYGIPRSPVTRQIPIYNVSYSSIHCRNTPEAVHPGFYSCNGEFKEVLLFYYDCIISSMYRGYVAFNCDASVENFQTWLLWPMEVFGMCWP